MGLLVPKNWLQNDQPQTIVMSSRVDLRDHLNQYSSSFSNSNFISGVRSKHGDLNRETELNLRSIFSIWIPYFMVFCLMILYRVKVKRGVIFIWYIASVVPLIFPPKTLIWNKLVLLALNLLKVLKLVKNDLDKKNFFCIPFIEA